jgi:hypothetical protein
MTTDERELLKLCKECVEVLKYLGRDGSLNADTPQGWAKSNPYALTMALVNDVKAARNAKSAIESRLDSLGYLKK